MTGKKPRKQSPTKSKNPSGATPPHTEKHVLNPGDNNTIKMEITVKELKGEKGKGFLNCFNKIEKLLSFPVNVALAVGTFFLYSEASKQGKIAEVALRSSDSANIQAQKRFEVEFEPYIQMDSFFVINPKVGDSVKLHFRASNLKVIPIKLIAGHLFKPRVKTIADLDRFILGLKDKIKTNKTIVTTNYNFTDYLINGSPMPFNAGLKEKWDEKEDYGFFSGTMPAYFVGVFEYINLINKKFRFYWFAVEIKKMNSIAQVERRIYNENEDAPVPANE